MSKPKAGLRLPPQQAQELVVASMAANGNRPGTSMSQLLQLCGQLTGAEPDAAGV